MAISKLMHMKETAGNPSRHLKRAIENIMISWKKRMIKSK